MKDDNKKQLIEVMFSVRSSETFKEKFQNRKVILITVGAAHEVSGDRNAIPELLSNQEETDSRVILYCMYGAEQDYDHVRVRTPDSDI